MRISDSDNRATQYMPSKDEEEMLRAMNEKLAESPPPGQVPAYPVIFVFGSPRSGSTMMAQALSQYLQVGYVDNLAARFWLAPVTGLRLSKALFKNQKTSDFLSEYGRTKSSDIHGFHYFWMHFLNLQDVRDLFTPMDQKNVDWDVIRGHIAAMEKVENRPLVFKGYYQSYFMADFAKEIPGCVFVMIRRNPLDQALSIYEARTRVMKSITSWWSMPPPGVEALMDLPEEEQIAAQIFELESFYDDQVASSGGKLPVITVRYEDIQKNPEDIMEVVRLGIRDLKGVEIPSTGVLPTVWDNRCHGHLNDMLPKLEKALAKYNKGRL